MVWVFIWFINSSMNFRCSSTWSCILTLSWIISRITKFGFAFEPEMRITARTFYSPIPQIDITRCASFGIIWIHVLLRPISLANSSTSQFSGYQKSMAFWTWLFLFCHCANGENSSAQNAYLQWCQISHFLPIYFS